jgi:hypothetical protein
MRIDSGRPDPSAQASARCPVQEAGAQRHQGHPRICLQGHGHQGCSHRTRTERGHLGTWHQVGPAPRSSSPVPSVHLPSVVMWSKTHIQASATTTRTQKRSFTHWLPLCPTSRSPQTSECVLIVSLINAANLAAGSVDASGRYRRVDGALPTLQGCIAILISRIGVPLDVWLASNRIWDCLPELQVRRLPIRLRHPS